jgi:hypothetical protein
VVVAAGGSGGGAGGGVWGWWWGWRAVVVPPAVSWRGVGKCCNILLFLTLFKSLCRELYMLLGTDAAQMCRGIWWGSRHRALCRPDGAECAVPRASSRQRLCREDSGLCREHITLGNAMDSGSVFSTRHCWYHVISNFLFMTGHKDYQGTL